MAKSLKCPCGRLFSTSQANRKRCYSCSPARLRDVSERDPELTAASDAVPVPVASRFGKITAATMAELERLGWEDSVEGALAESLARDLDGDGLPGAQRTSMSKQLTAMMESIRAVVPKAPDAVDSWQDRLRQKREQA